MRYSSRMKAAGCIEVAVGIESLVPEVFERIDKKESIDSILEGIQMLRRNGLKVIGYFIIGLPGDNYRGTMETFRKAKNIVDGQSWTLMLPIKGTPFWEELHHDNRVRWLHDYRDIDMTWLPRLSQVKTAFETPDYPQRKKCLPITKLTSILALRNTESTQANSRTLSGIVWLILTHAPWKGTWNLLLGLPGLWRKLLSGKIPLSQDGLYLVQDR